VQKAKNVASPAQNKSKSTKTDAKEGKNIASDKQNKSE
jgi:hypothetical protein